MKTSLASFRRRCSVALLAGCVSLATAALGQEGATFRLPVGLTLLGAADAPCGGVLMIESGSGRADEDAGRVGPGQHAVFEVESENVAWTCLGDRDESSSDTMECPDETTHLRILRNEDEDVVLFECYG